MEMNSKRIRAIIAHCGRECDMRIMILGGDGYLGWPTAMAFGRAGHEVLAIDNYLRRKMAAETRLRAAGFEPAFAGPRRDLSANDRALD